MRLKPFYEAAKSSLTGNLYSKLTAGPRAKGKTPTENLDSQADATEYIDFDNMLSRLAAREKK
ncbi:MULTISPECIES: hypothetical protein [Brucella]|uniref:hypothetical protein n=1 Tax=Brucella sp. NBRC 13694 TaxID=3075482 RepID=UPI0028AF9763|nr:hypothetical protein [Brucella anthropi]